jgi:hypothetical protein
MKIIRTVLLTILLGLMTSQAGAQLKTWVSLETGPQWSIIKVTDPGHYFQGANVRSFVGGVTIGQEIIPNLSLSTGVLYIPQNDGINMIDQRPNQSSWRSSSSILIPLRAEYTIQPTEFPVSFTPRIGYIYNVVTQPSELYTASSVLSAPDGTSLSYDIQQVDDKPVSHLIEIGMGIHLRFPNAWRASLNLSYMTGLLGSPTTRYELNYSDYSGSSSSTEYTSRGNSLITTLALNIPVSNIWQNKDYRVRKRVENSVYKGKPVSKRGLVYLGGEIGSLWRVFNSSNPAVGPRPMEGKGIFKYANLHSGIYGGYMLTNELGIDLGAYYQRSSTFYALMYDHEVDYVTRTQSPFYLEIPLRFRYFYNAYKEKIHVVVYGGASLLTQFSSGVYNQGTDGFNYTSPATGVPVDATTTYEASGVIALVPVLRLGTGIEYALPTKFPLIATLYLNYMQGYMDIGEITVSNSTADSPPVSVVNYNGSGWSVDFGIKVPFRLGGPTCGQLPQREPK